MVFNGTAVTRGRGVAVVTATGMATEMGKIARLLGQTESEQTPLQREVSEVGRMLGRAVIVIALVVVGAILLTADTDHPSDLVDVLLIGVSLAVAAVPEGLPVILSVVLALGVQRMARRNAIVKRLSSVETLGSASVVCSDKTGTLRENEMTIQEAVTPSGDVEVTGSGYRPEGEVRADGHVVGRGAGAAGRGRRDRGAAAGDPDPVDQPAHRQRARDGAGRRPAAAGRHAPLSAATDGPHDQRRDVAGDPLHRPGDGGRHGRRGAPSAGCSRTAGCGARSRSRCCCRSRSSSCRS
jgi:magnesium-transporting ATPase (P-type)